MEDRSSRARDPPSPSLWRDRNFVWDFGPGTEPERRARMGYNQVTSTGFWGREKGVAEWKIENRKSQSGRRGVRINAVVRASDTRTNFFDARCRELRRLLRVSLCGVSAAGRRGAIVLTFEMENGRWKNFELPSPVRWLWISQKCGRTACRPQGIPAQYQRLATVFEWHTRCFKQLWPNVLSAAQFVCSGCSQ
jgi:hypothetical protein